MAHVLACFAHLPSAQPSNAGAWPPPVAQANLSPWVIGMAALACLVAAVEVTVLTLPDSVFRRRNNFSLFHGAVSNTSMWWGVI